MKTNPWEKIALDDYEGHMSLPNVKQLQVLSQIMKEQIDEYAIRTLAVLGVAGGNGLEHVAPEKINLVYGIDVNEEYLNACKKRFSELKDHLVLMKLDLLDETQKLPPVDLVIADLLVEYIGVDLFTRHISASGPAYVSCAIQQNEKESFVSESPYTNVFSGISELHSDIQPDSLSESLEKAGYAQVLSKKYSLPNGKSLVRLDFAKKD